MIVHRAEEPEALAAILPGALSLAFDSNAAVALLLSQRLIGAKRF